MVRLFRVDKRTTLTYSAGNCRGAYRGHQEAFIGAWSVGDFVVSGGSVVQVPHVQGNCEARLDDIEVHIRRAASGGVEAEGGCVGQGSASLRGSWQDNASNVDHDVIVAVHNIVGRVGHISKSDGETIRHDIVVAITVCDVDTVGRSK